MRILYAADLHYALRQFDWLGQQVSGHDLAVLGGDLLDLGSGVDMEVQEVVVQKYLRRYGGERVLLVSSGNHDIQQLSPAGERTARWMEELGGPMITPDYGSYEKDGVLFTVCSWWDGPETRARVVRLVSRTVRPASLERLIEVMDAISAEAHRRGLTDEILEEELAAYNAERRDRPPGA